MLTNQEKFLIEHNRLSPLNLQADLTLLNKFRQEKPTLFKDESWPVEKIRRPFIVWLSSLRVQPETPKSCKKTQKEKISGNNSKGFHNYPLEEA